MGKLQANLILMDLPLNNLQKVLGLVLTTVTGLDQPIVMTNLLIVLSHK